MPPATRRSPKRPPATAPRGEWPTGAAPAPLPKRRNRLPLLLAASVGLLVVATPFSVLWPPLLERLPDSMLEREAAAFPRDPWPRIVLGERRLAAGKPREALEQFGKVPEGTSLARLGLDLAEATLASGLPERARDLAIQLEQMAPQSAVRHRILGESRVAMGDYSAGMAELEQAVRLDPSDPKAYLALAQARIEFEGPRPATALLLEQGLAKCPASNPGIRYLLADVYVMVGRYEEAESLTANLDREGEPAAPPERALFARAQFARGALLRRFRPDRDRRYLSRESLETALRILPEYPDAHFELGMLFADETTWRAAADQFEMATSLRPYAHPVWFHLARAQRRLGLSADAVRSEARFRLLVETFERVNSENRWLDEHPGDHLRRLKLAELLLNRQDLDAAAGQLDLLAAALPADPRAAALRRRLEQARAVRGGGSDASPR